jgi:hypothetical protein
MAKTHLLSTTAPSAAPTAITGCELRQLIHGKGNRFRGAAAAAAVRGTLRVESYSPVQAARLFDVGVGYVTAALGSTVKRGPRDSTIEKINKVVRRFGVDALMAGCHRATAPHAAQNGNAARDDFVV